MCAIFGPVRRETVFSQATLPYKTDEARDPKDTLDYSVDCLHFEAGVIVHITCSIAVPTDQQMWIIGKRYVLSVVAYRDYRSPVQQEPCDPVPLKARYLRLVREYTLLQWLKGGVDSRIPLAEVPPPGSTDVVRPTPCPDWACQTPTISLYGPAYGALKLRALAPWISRMFMRT